MTDATRGCALCGAAREPLLEYEMAPDARADSTECRACFEEHEAHAALAWWAELGRPE